MCSYFDLRNNMLKKNATNELIKENDAAIFGYAQPSNLSPQNTRTNMSIILAKLPPYTIKIPSSTCSWNVLKHASGTAYVNTEHEITNKHNGRRVSRKSITEESPD